MQKKIFNNKKTKNETFFQKQKVRGGTNLHWYGDNELKKIIRTAQFFYKLCSNAKFSEKCNSKVSNAKKQFFNNKKK